MTDHYQALGIHPHASVDEIRAAYHRVMRRAHPDVRPADPTAAEVARAATAAWTVLRDGERRRAYDVARGHRRLAPRHHASRAAHRVYSPDGQAYRRAFSLACAKIAAATFAGGFIVLLAV